MFAVSGLLISTLTLASCCHASDVVLIRSNRGASAEQEQMQLAAGFYGINLKVVTASSGADNLSIRTAVEQKETVGVAIEADVLAAVNENTLLGALDRKVGRGVPLLILGVTPDLSPALLNAWSGGGATRCARVENSSDAQHAFGQVDGVTWQLAGISVPSVGKNAFYFSLEESGRAQRIEDIWAGSRIFPIFIESAIGRQKVFLASGSSEGSDVLRAHDVVSGFLQIAPAMIFVRYCAGERGWHPLHYYANFTIDDPWLREPYGYVDYQSLLGEMDKHHFHTTIAFIPWNYYRSQAEVVSLFRKHPDRLSIAIHGDNHDHKEFTEYRRKPLAVQVDDLKQALARMERFQTLTGIPYDKVMIFPHSIAPEQTLGALKKYNYLATVNSSNIPQNQTNGAGLPDILRPVTLSFEGFPSIGRYSAAVQVPEAYLAINQFLGNSLFFYSHSSLFSRTISAFDRVADEVNKREPATEWRSLGEIVRHLYVVKLRDDSNYDVMAFSNHICLENTTGRNSTFYLQKQEIGDQTIESVTVDGRVQPYTLQKGQMNMVVPIPLGATHCVAVQYANDMQMSSIHTSGDSAIVYLLRMGSDFRDIYFARSRAGLAAIRFYNEHELKPLEVVGFMLVLFAVLICAGYLLGVSARRRSPSNQGRPESLTN